LTLLDIGSPPEVKAHIGILIARIWGGVTLQLWQAAAGTPQLRRIAFGG
jgi:hypothetical protein